MSLFKKVKLIAHPDVLKIILSRNRMTHNVPVLGEEAELCVPST
jgi:hypothetical protein